MMTRLRVHRFVYGKPTTKESHLEYDQSTEK